MIRDNVRMVFRASGLGALTSLMLPAYLVRDRIAAQASEADRRAVRNRWVYAWSGLLLDLFGIELEAFGMPPGESGRGRLIVANHRSAIDIGILLRLFGGHMVSRNDLADWPLIGAAARSVGTVFVDRTDSGSGASAIRSIRALLKSGATVCIFPEGTTFEGDEVRPFHQGAFIAALHTSAQIIPVGIAYPVGSGAAFVNESFPAHLARMSRSTRTRAAVTIGPPIEVGKRRASDISNEVHSAVQSLVDQSRVRLEGIR